jgi:hypothetical protein
MHMWIVGVPMTDRDPVEPGAEIALDPGCQVACEGFEIGHFGGILRCDDEAEMMPVVQAAPRERHGVGAILGGAEHVGLLTAASDAVTLQVGEWAESGAQWKARPRCWTTLALTTTRRWAVKSRLRPNAVRPRPNVDRPYRGAPLLPAAEPL